MQSVVTFLSGKKTYIIAALTVLIGVLQGNVQLTLTGILSACLRAGIAKV